MSRLEWTLGSLLSIQSRASARDRGLAMDWRRACALVALYGRVHRHIQSLLCTKMRSCMHVRPVKSDETIQHVLSRRPDRAEPDSPRRVRFEAVDSGASRRKETQVHAQQHHSTFGTHTIRISNPFQDRAATLGSITGVIHSAEHWSERKLVKSSSLQSLNKTPLACVTGLAL